MAGRPTDFKEEYCDDLIDHMARGYSFESFAAVVRVNRDTIYHWTKIHPSFSDAKEEAFEQSRLFWEQKGIEGLFNTSEVDRGAGTSSSKSMNAAVWIFTMKNRFPNEWKDKHETEHSGNMGLTWNETKTYPDAPEPEANPGA